ncbi:MAG TPA: GNAT family N-acetyltransferase [Acidimicrobiales bacterium]|jgi:GNAT superfamily N-acetyltransferase|nr:GNAT family N-acetyltransferase [Acidimicrobiales bacterium]
MEAVRTATVEDTRRLLELSEEFVRGVTSTRGGSLLVQPSLEASGDGGLVGRLPQLLGDDTCLVLVGTIDEVVTGFALCHVEDLAGQGRRGILDGCYVEPGARGVGVGRLLLDTAVTWLEDHRCQGVDGIALPGDRAAKNFFESAGFKARMLTMYRELG